MKKIAFYCTDYPPNQSGYAFAFQGLVNAMLDATSDYEVDVFTPVTMPPGMPDAKRERLRVVRVHRNHAIKNIAYLRTVWRLIVWPWQMAQTIASADAHDKYDFIVFESIDDVMVFAYLPESVKKKTVIRIHGCSETEYAVFGRGGLIAFKRLIISWVISRYARVIVATTPFYLDFVKKWYLGENVILAARKLFSVVPNTIKSDLLCKSDEHFKQPTFNMITLGRMDAQGAGQKGFLDLFLALSMVRPETRKRIRLTVIGAGSQRSNLIEAAGCVETLEVNFMESVSNAEVIRLLKESHAAVLASRYEGMSVFAMEALAYGCPVIYSEAGGLKELVDGNGYSFPPSNPEDLAEAIEAMLAMTPYDLSVMSRKSNEVFSRFSPDRAARKLLLAAKFLVESPNSLG